MADKRRSPYQVDRTDPNLPPWQSAARPGPVVRSGGKPVKPRRFTLGAPDGPDERAASPRRAPLRSKPLKLATKRRSGAMDWITGAIRACIVAILLLFSLMLAGSAPVESLPDVETRFADWKQTQNESAVNPLPRRDAEPQ